jgi:HNH endonuclease
MKICAIPECGGVVFGRVWCSKHYGRWLRHGDPLGGKSHASPGQGSIRSTGYRAFAWGGKGSSKEISEHVLVAEKALGRALKNSEEVHHINKIKSDNRNENLVICPDRAYHMLLHQRMRALDACGNANWLRCPFCKIYDDPKNMYVNTRGRRNDHYHRRCINSDFQKRRDAKKENL